MLDAAQPPLSVSELTTLLNNTLEQKVGMVSFQGEVSQITRANSGHLYFSIKDPNSERGNQLPAVLWKNVVNTLTFKLEEGIAVICRGKPNVYLVNGRLQMLVYEIIPAGDGLLKQKFEILKNLLASEGLFTTERKRPLPFFPKVIGVVTSATGAALQDIIAKLEERMPSIKVYLAGARVQGEGAAQEIASSIKLLSQIEAIEVIIVARGGGSLQDLWAFNEEVVVRAIFASRVPVVSGVGHEVDVTLSDLVADYRAPTPTAAAEVVVPDAKELSLTLNSLTKRLFSIERNLSSAEQSLDEISLRAEVAIKGYFSLLRAHFKVGISRINSLKPSTILLSLLDKINFYEGNLNTQFLNISLQNREILNNLNSKLKYSSIPMKLKLYNERLIHSSIRLKQGLDRTMSKHHETISYFEQTLSAISPHRVIERGYALILKKGKVVSDVNSLDNGEEIEAKLSNGQITATVSNILPNPQCPKNY